MNFDTPTALIGDIIKSRDFPDPVALFEDVAEGLDWLATTVPSTQPPRLMTGDEFQGVFPDLPSALRATTLLSLHLADVCRFRFGIGGGEIITDEKRLPAAQSGTAWWHAREAIDDVARVQAGSKGWPSTVTTMFRTEDKPLSALVNAFLICRDQILGRFDSRDATIALALFVGGSQESVGRRIGIGQSAVSNRQRRNGPSSLFRAHESLDELLKTA